MTEPFPDTLCAIRNAFDMKDPTSNLLEFIRAHPELSTITVVVITYISTSPTKQSPSLVDKLADTLVHTKSPLADLVKHELPLNRELDDHLGSELASVEDASVSPSNERLVITLCNNYDVFALYHQCFHWRIQPWPVLRNIRLRRFRSMPSALYQRVVFPWL